MTMADLDILIDELSDDAAPVKVATSRTGRIGLALVALGSFALAAIKGWRADLWSAAMPTQLWLTLGLLGLLAAAAGGGAVRMARPQVGAAASGTGWALAGVTTLLFAALIAIVGGSHDASVAGGWRCTAYGSLFGVATFLFLAAWLKRGAPVQPERAATLAGIAAGAVGGFAISLDCPSNAIAHVGIWHLLPILIGAAAGRLLLPRLLRW